MTPVSADRRAARLPVVFALLRRWHHDGPNNLERRLLAPIGLEQFLFDPADLARLLDRRYDRWLARGRFTAEMAVVLLLALAERLRYQAADPAGDPFTERDHLIQALMVRRGISSIRAFGRGEAALLEDLEVLQRNAAAKGAWPELIEITKDGLRLYKEDPHVAMVYAALKKKHRAALDLVLADVDARIDRSERLDLPRPTYRSAPIWLGEGERLRQRRDQFEAELGPKFLDPAATLDYRTSRVRKWKQLALSDGRAGTPGRVV